MTAIVTHGDARSLPFPDDSIDLVVTSPPYWSLRQYAAGSGEGVPIGEEPRWQDYLASLVACTAEMARVIKPGGSIWVNLGDKYSSAAGPKTGVRTFNDRHEEGGRWPSTPRGRDAVGVPPKSLLLLPHRYAIACMDELGLIVRQDQVWTKPNGLPESVTDRTRRSHEYLFHLTKTPRYFAAVDEIREPHTRTWGDSPNGGHTYGAMKAPGAKDANLPHALPNPLGKLPGSVWSIPTQPLQVPEHLDVDHFAAYPFALVRPIIQGWSPREVCTACGEGRRPVSTGEWYFQEPNEDMARRALARAHVLGITPQEVGEVYGVRAIGDDGTGKQTARDRDRVDDALIERMGSATYARQLRGRTKRARSGYACACTDTSAPTTPGVCLDPFGGTGTTALVADVLGRTGIALEASMDYLRIAQWRTTDPRERAAAAEKPRPKIVHPPSDEQFDLFAAFDGEVSA